MVLFTLGGGGRYEFQICPDFEQAGEFWTCSPIGPLARQLTLSKVSYLPCVALGVILVNVVTSSRSNVGKSQKVNFLGWCRVVPSHNL